MHMLMGNRCGKGGVSSFDHHLSNVVKGVCACESVTATHWQASKEHTHACNQ